MAVCLSSNGQSKLSGSALMFQTLKKIQIKFQTSLSPTAVRVLAEGAVLGSAGGARLPSLEEESTSRVSRLLCLSHGCVKLGTVNRE